MDHSTRAWPRFAVIYTFSIVLLMLSGASCGGDDGTQPYCDGVICGEFASCEESAEGMTCVCDDGYSGDGQTCTAIDYCDGVTCGANAHCEQVGNASECTCDAGYSGDGQTCTAIDYCDGVTCGANAHCEQLGHASECACDAGYAGDGQTCTAVDYCDGVTCGANAHCEQLGHANICLCDAGYTGDGQTCTAIEYCDGVTCGANAHCEQLGHASICACDDGFQGDGTTCTNLDECALQMDDCSADATCIDTVPGYNCRCLAGFDGDGRTCQDIDECAPLVTPCDANATCQNSVGGFDCTCNSGFAGNGIHCVDSEPPAFGGVVSATASFEGTVDIAWQAATDNVDDPSDLLYEVCLGTAAGACETSFVAHRTSAPGETSLTVDLGYTQRRWIVVRVRDLAGNRDANVVEQVASTHPVTYPITYGDAPVGYSQIVYETVNLAGTGYNVATVSPGASTSVAFTFRIWGSCGGCWYVAALGISPADSTTTTWLNCFYDFNPTATGAPGDPAASRSISFTAPTTPGIYHLVTRRLADYLPQCLVAGGSALTSSIATLIVQ